MRYKIFLANGPVNITSSKDDDDDDDDDDENWL